MVLGMQTYSKGSLNDLSSHKLFSERPGEQPQSYLGVLGYKHVEKPNLQTPHPPQEEKKP